jgi:saccharopine dehydrogenase (NADP+, L-glutamate forming)
MLIHLLKKKLPLQATQRDMVVIQHEVDVEYPEGPDRVAERVTSTLVAEGEEGGFTAMAKTVGLPVAIAAEMLLEGELSLTGSQIPTHPSIYEPELIEIANDGLEFRESVRSLAAVG